MDPLYLSRIAMAGWIFVVVLGSSISCGNPVFRSSVLHFLMQHGKDEGTFIVAIIGALVGLGGPPALGFLLERFASLMIAVTRQSMWDYDFRVMTSALADHGSSADVRITPAGLFHAAFYSAANPQLIDWCRRHRAQMYSSCVGAVAIALGLAMAVPIFSGLSSALCYAGWIVVMFILIAAGVIASRQHRAVVNAWISACGRESVNALSAAHRKGDNTGTDLDNA